MVFLDEQNRLSIAVQIDCDMDSYLKGYAEAIRDVQRCIKSKPNNKERLEMVANFCNKICGELKENELQSTQGESRRRYHHIEDTMV